MAALASVSVLIAAGVMMSFNFNTGGVIIAADAQPTNSRACPVGFELNKGRCEAPAEEIPAQEDGCERPEVEFNLEGRGRVCAIYQETVSVVGGVIGGNCPVVNNPLVAIGPNTDGVTCDIYQITSVVIVTPGGLTCDNIGGKLNEDSGMCEIKPGRRNR